ncbi:hypothetical protein PVK06_033983 [Gossypium arboreum]|uniref:Retrovirus-related Pol polyprotein from transposon TNT 1-94 n=1 Tax=Gossypium arboreum TaxID=29729 RepID=A0ABR0NDU0_GOSAR|nr:hypothetical protein PVK06_033983 [Gossypium arboreum]
MLNGTSFKEWRRHLLIVLGCINIDLALREEQLAPLTAESNLMGIESEEITQVKCFIDEIEKHFARNDKIEITSLLASLMFMKYKGKRNVREYIMEMFHVASRFKALKIELLEELLVLMVLVSLPTLFNQFKISYNCQKEKWTLNEFISHCVQEEERLKHDKSESAHLTNAFKDKG